MNDLELFLKDLSDSELAVFISYRFEDFLENSRQRIINEVKQRGLNQKDLKQLYDKGLHVDADSNVCCPQCGSDRFFLETVYELVQRKYGSYEVAVESNRCRICGFNPAKNSRKGLINKIKQKLGFYKETRLKRPDIDGQMFT
jgi:hypothetical protein